MISQPADMADGTKMTVQSLEIISGDRIQAGSQNNVPIPTGDIDQATVDQMKSQAKLDLSPQMTGAGACEVRDDGHSWEIAKPLHDFNPPDRCRDLGTCTNSHLLPASKLGTLVDILLGVNGHQEEGSDACPSIVAAAAANHQSPHGRPDMTEGMAMLPATAQLIEHKEETVPGSNTGMNRSIPSA